MNLNLNHEGFEDYLVEKRCINFGIQYQFKFPNNYGASVIKGPYSYGGDVDLWELAVVRWRGDNYDLEYDTDITDDVIGYLDDKEVRDLLELIKNLSD